MDRKIWHVFKCTPMHSCIILPFNYFSRRLYKRIYFQEFEKKIVKTLEWIANRANLIGGLGKVHRHFQRAASVNPVCFSADASWCQNIRSNRHQERGDKNGCGQKRSYARASFHIYFFFYLRSLHNAQKRIARLDVTCRAFWGYDYWIFPRWEDE